MTLIFNIETPEKCQLCFIPVKGKIYQHQCRPVTQKLCCFTCLAERGICRFCNDPFTKLKYADSTFNFQLYYAYPSPRTTRIFLEDRIEDRPEDDWSEDRLDGCSVEEDQMEDIFPLPDFGEEGEDLASLSIEDDLSANSRVYGKFNICTTFFDSKIYENYAYDACL